MSGRTRLSRRARSMATAPPPDERPRRLLWYAAAIWFAAALVVAATLLPPPVAPWENAELGLRAQVGGLLVGALGIGGVVLSLAAAVSQLGLSFPAQEITYPVEAAGADQPGRWRLWLLNGDAFVSNCRVELAVIRRVGSGTRDLLPAEVPDAPDGWEVRDAPRPLVFVPPGPLYPRQRVAGPVIDTAGADRITWSALWWTDRSGLRVSTVEHAAGAEGPFDSRDS